MNKQNKQARTAVDRLKAVMRQKKIRQGEMSKKLGMSHATISNYFRHQQKPKLDTFIEMCEMAGIAVTMFDQDNDCIFDSKTLNTKYDE